MEKLIIGLLRLLCPFLKKMAAKTENRVDDMVVNIICAIAAQEPKEEE